MTAMPSTEPRTKRGWDFDEGQEIVPGRHVQRQLGGGWNREAYAAFDDVLHYPVAPPARPRPGPPGRQAEERDLRVGWNRGERAKHDLSPALHHGIVR
jgi:hypothetical protein